MTTAKPGARFLPTLTEVVRLIPEQAQSPKDSADPVLELTQRATLLLEERLASRMEALITAQAQNVLDGLREEIRQAVSDAVKQALREGE